MSTILVTGATGRLGRLVVRRLLERGRRVRVLTRRPDEAHRLWGERVETATGDFAAPTRLAAAFAGAERLFLLSPIGEELVAHQKAAIDAAAAAGVRRVVKLSGSDWTVGNPDRSVSGSAHARVEAHLEASGLARTVIRPNAWMQVSLAPVVAAAARGEPLPVRYGDAAVSFVDAEDIAEVAAVALVADTPLEGPLVLTGERALTALQVASAAARLLKRPVSLADRPAGPPRGLEPFERRAVAEFVELIAEGQAASVTDTVERVTGRPPRSVERFLARQFLAASMPKNATTGEKTWH